MVCAVVGGSQRRATSSRVIPRERRTSLIPVIIGQPPARKVTSPVFHLSYSFAYVARGANWENEGARMKTTRHARLLADHSVDGSQAGIGGACPRRSVTINLAESPLGWLLARGHVSRRQYEAGERLRSDWERAQL